MPVSAALTAAITTSDIFSSMTTVFELLMDQFTTTVSTITSNPLLFVPVLCGFGGGLIMAGVKVVRKLGVRGMAPPPRLNLKYRRGRGTPYFFWSD